LSRIIQDLGPCTASAYHRTCAQMRNFTTTPDFQCETQVASSSENQFIVCNNAGYIIELYVFFKQLFGRIRWW